MSSKIQSSLRKALEKVPGVIDAKVDYDHRTATVKYNPEKASPAAFVKATTNAGFPSKAGAMGRKSEAFRRCPSIGTDLPTLWPRNDGDDAFGFVSLLLSVRSMQRSDSAKSRRLLRFLLVWFHKVSTDPVARSLL